MGHGTLALQTFFNWSPDVGIFSNIVNAIFHHSAAAPAGGTAQTAPSAAASPAAAPTQTVDAQAVLTKLAASKGGGGNWQTSIVDLLKLLDLDSSLDARKQLGAELGVHAGADGSAEQNIALQKAVMQKLAENGGKMPADLKA